MLLLSIFRDYWLSFTAFGLFGLLHSIGARESFKDALSRRTSPLFVEHFWRLLYCLLSYLWFYKVVGFLHWGQHPQSDTWLIAYPRWMWQAITVFHLGSIALLYAAFMQSDYLEFLGLKQAWRGVRTRFGQPRPQSPLKLFGTRHLEVRGVYGWVRHPMLVGGLLFLVTSGPSMNNFVFALMYALYMLIGGYYEERRLIRIFGRDYLDYRSRIGAYFPRLWPRRSA
jgi:methanethiol S-methyltransferase